MIITKIQLKLYANSRIQSTAILNKTNGVGNTG